jgi:hypothetical protein
MHALVVNEFGGASERKETRSLKSPQVRGGKLVLDMARFPDRFSLRAIFTGAYFLEINSIVDEYLMIFQITVFTIFNIPY